MLDVLPLTPNGKIDRRSLENLVDDQPTTSNIQLPKTDDEKLLASIWSEVLKVKQVGIHDNFFELGGHSLQAAQLISKIVSATNINISLKQLFLYPTIAQLADLLKKSAHKYNFIEPSNESFSEKSTTSITSPYFQQECRSLQSLLLTKEIPPVHAAALGYLPNFILEQTDLNQEQIFEQWFNNLPVIQNILDTAWGRIALLILPRLSSELYNDTDDFVNMIIGALKIAGQIGASTVSLTGIIPSATDYGRAITKVTANHNLPQITTGHSTTSATVVLTIQRILQESGREITKERVGVIGLGSIGLSSLCLMLKCLLHPVELILCDLYSKKEFLEDIRTKLVDELDFHGKIQLLFSKIELPTEIYNATLIVGATNVPDVFDINKVKSGTLIVDDSGPHCFKSELAIKRFQEHQDILFTEGGVLKSPQPISGLMYFPHHLERSLKNKQIEELFNKHNPFEITGCVFSSLLSASFENLKPTVGFVQLDESMKYYETLTSLGFQAADLHCKNYVLPNEAISYFRENFGNS
ncbi:phosphopantetheine-binding protein [Candidatus Halobeggiatoa sp. HSG11]|nr:phosphopantetheine-binding protein [Candidatus Halobeggiatoa sp. HSG11]